MSLPVVGIIMGSASDEPTMKKACDILDQLEIPYDVTVCSAHRNPDRTAEYAKRPKKTVAKSSSQARALPQHYPVYWPLTPPYPSLAYPVHQAHSMA